MAGHALQGYGSARYRQITEEDAYLHCEDSDTGEFRALTCVATRMSGGAFLALCA